MSKRMNRKKEEKKKAILGAAEKIIAEKGPYTMTMDEIAREADVATGTLYLYFKNKTSLCAAVNASLNREVNAEMKKSMALYETGSEKVRAAGTGIVQFVFKHPQKWNAATELYQIKFDDPKDPNVQELIDEDDIGIQMFADAYRQAIKEGDLREDIDPVPTAIFFKMAFSNAFTPTTEQKLLLKRNNIDMNHYLEVARDLIIRSTHKTRPEDKGPEQLE